MKSEAVYKPVDATPVENPNAVSRRSAVALLALAVLLLIASCVSLALWFQADMYSKVKSVRKPGFLEYGATNVWGLAVYTFVAPWVLPMAYLGIRTIVSHANPYSDKRPVALVMAFIGLMLAVFAVTVWAGPMAECGFFWCLNPAAHPAPTPDADYGHGPAVTNWNGFVVTVISLAFSVAMLRIALSQTCDGVAKSMKCLLCESSKVDWLLAFISALCVICMFIGTAYLPGQMPTRFNPWAMAQWAASPAQCANANSNSTSCPELENHFFTTTSYQINSYTYWNMFPANVAFYVYLLVMIVGGVCVNSSSNFRGFLQRRRFYTCGRRIYVTIAGSVAWFATFVMLLVFGLYWLHDHRYNSSADGEYSTAVRLARGFGQLAVAFMSLQMFPIARTSVVHRILGTSPESFLYVHRVLGYLTLIAIILHIAMWWVMYRESNMDIPILKIPTYFPAHFNSDGSVQEPLETSNFTIPLQTIVVLFFLPAMGVLTLAPIRRKAWELFKYTHLVAAYAIIPSTIYHAAQSWQYLLPGLTVYLIDRFIRMSRSGRHVPKATVTAVDENIVMVQFEGGVVTHRAGQYVYINVPCISLFEWHPFTISSGPEAEVHTLHIRSHGPGSFTGRLRALADAGPAAIELFVDGPCGATNLHLRNDYDSIVLVAGGIGITPCASIAKDLIRAGPVMGSDSDLRSSRVTLVWVTRNGRALAETLNLPTASSNADYMCAGISTLAVEAYDTTQRGDGNDWHFARSSGWTFKSGRPNMTEVMERCLPRTAERPIVFCCGPREMCDDAVRAAFYINRRVMVHQETFEL